MMSHSEKPQQDFLNIAKTVIGKEADVLKQTASRLGDAFVQAVNIILQSSGKVVITGIGKSGHIGQKIASTLCSTGTPSVFLHASEAMHGDLGIYHPGDPTILISKSGSTAEIARLIPTLREFNSPLIALVGNLNSTLAQQADVTLDATVPQEADPLGIVPTSSALVTLALGDALASALMAARDFKQDDFARFHPAGQLGRNLLLSVQDVMHPYDSIGRVHLKALLRDIVICMTEHSLGAACVEDDQGHLAGIVTDGDIRRALQAHDDINTLTADDIMTVSPISISPSASLSDAVKLMEDRPSQISVLPVVAPEGNTCLGLLRIHDIYQPHLL